jgi:hypothetical protein
MMNYYRNRAINVMKKYSATISGILTFITIFTILLCAGYEARAGSAGDSGGSVVAEQRDLYGVLSLPCNRDASQVSPGHSVQPIQWDIRFISPTPGIQANTGLKQPASAVQRGRMNCGTYSLLAELGSLQLPGLPPLFKDLSYRGGRVSLGTRFSGNSLSLAVFTATSGFFAGTDHHIPGSGQEYNIAGTTGDIGFLAGKARIKTFFVTADEIPGVPTIDRPMTLHSGGAAKVSSSIDPFAGQVVLETDIAFSRLGNKSAGESRDVRDIDYMLKLGGERATFGYRAAVEHQVSEYILSASGVTRKDKDRYSLGSKVEQPEYSLSLDLSRLQSRMSGAGLQMKGLTFEGKLACAYKGIEVLPVALQYSKTFDTVTSGQNGEPSSKTETDTFSGDIHYNGGLINMDLNGRFSERKDLLMQRGEQAVAAVSFSPRLVLDDLSIAHSISLHRLQLFADNSRIDTYTFKLGAKGRVPEGILNYELNGGFLRSESSPSDSVNESVTTNFRISMPFPQLFDGWKTPSLGINGEYKSNLRPSYGQDNFSLFLSIENG